MRDFFQGVDRAVARDPAKCNDGVSAYGRILLLQKNLNQYVDRIFTFQATEHSNGPHPGIAIRAGEVL